MHWRRDPLRRNNQTAHTEPEADYELRPDGSGGCEDPRVTYVQPLHRYIMSYTAFSPAGPRIAFAQSEDLLQWHRLGLATYAHWHGVELGNVDDKDASLFPVAIPNSSGQLELGMLHRPLFPGTRPEEIATFSGKRLPDIEKESIWISYCGGALKGRETLRLRQFTSHHRLATPDSPWERLKIGCDNLGTPDRFDVYYGMADSRIGVARLDVPECLPVGGDIDSDDLEAMV